MPIVLCSIIIYSENNWHHDLMRLDIVLTCIYTTGVTVSALYNYNQLACDEFNLI